MVGLATKIDRNWPAGRKIGTTADLALVGLGPRLLAEGIKCGLVVRLRHGAYIKIADWQDQFPSDRDMLRLMAHLHATRGKALYSHLSAARVRGLFVWGGKSDIHVTAPSSVSARSRVAGVIVHRRTLDRAVRRLFRSAILGDVRVTSLEQTIVDCARTESFVTAVIVGDCGLHRGASMTVMENMLDAIPGHRGVRAARKVLAALNKDSESAGETRLRLIVADMDLPQPDYQVRVYARGNQYRLDGAWREMKLALEFDGKTKYFHYKRTEEAIYAERLRERELMEEGWVFLRVVWQDLASPDVLKHRIVSAMETARKRYPV